MNELISIAREDEELGSWSVVEVESMLRCGTLSPTDYFWRPGMVEWSTLDCLRQAQPGKKTYPVSFVSASSTDNFGFIRDGKVTLGQDTIEFAGVRPWPVWMRVFVFGVMTPALWFIFYMLSDLLPRDGQTFAWARIIIKSCAFLGTPFAILLLIERSCVHSSSVLLERYGIPEMRRTGRLLSFVVLEKSGVSRKVRFVASYRLMAQELEDAIKQMSSSNSVRMDALATSIDPEQKAALHEESVIGSSESIRRAEPT